MKIGVVAFIGAIVMSGGCLTPSLPDRDPVETRVVSSSGEIWSPKPSTPPWTELKHHTRFDQRRIALHLAVSRDGSFIVYSAADSLQRAQLFVRSAKDESAPIQVTFNNADSLYPSISPDGKLIAFASDKDGDWNIYVIRKANPVGVMQVTFGGGNEIEPSFSPDGKGIAYTSESPDGYREIATVDLFTRATTFLGPGSNPSWSPHPKSEEQMIVFQSTDVRGNPKIMTVKPDGTDLREFEPWQGEEASQPSWSPDGKWVAFVVSTSDRTTAIELARVDGTSILRLFDDQQVKERPSWGGDRIFFIADDDGVKNISSVKPLPLGLLDGE